MWSDDVPVPRPLGGQAEHEIFLWVVEVLSLVGISLHFFVDRNFGGPEMDAVVLVFIVRHGLVSDVWGTNG